MAQAFNPLVARLVMAGTLNGEQYRTVVHAVKQDETPWTQADLQNLANKGKSFWEIDLAPLVSVQLALREFKAVQLIPGVAPQAVAASVFTGAQIGEPMPNSVAVAVGFKTGFTGRSAAGRVYQGGITNDMVNGNLFAQGALDDFAEAWRQFRIRLSETGAVSMKHVVYSQVTGGALRTQGAWFEVNETSIVDNVVDSQRRRLPGRGR